MYAFISFWMLSNIQVFENTAFPKQYKDDAEITGHNIFHFPNVYALILGILILVSVSYIIFYEVFLDFFSLFWTRSSKKKKKVLEAAGSVFNT